MRPTYASLYLSKEALPVFEVPCAPFVWQTTPHALSNHALLVFITPQLANLA